MANAAHLQQLRLGPAQWNRWRSANPDIIPDLSNADLSRRNLTLAFAPGAMTSIDLSSTNLAGAILDHASLRYALLDHADLSNIRGDSLDLNHARLRDAHLTDALLNHANLADTDLEGADLGGAVLTSADLWGARFVDANLAGADLTNAFIGAALFVNTRFGDNVGLDLVRFGSASQISLQTLSASFGRLPEAFLRGIGVPEPLMVYWRSLVIDPIELYSCFISYSSVDQPFVDRLHRDLDANHVRAWYALEDLRIGDQLRQRIDESIRLHDKLLLVLSEHSIASQWVEQEVETALEKERRSGNPTLFPIRIDDAALVADQGWAAYLRNTRHIGDFSHWRDGPAYQRAFARLLADLRQPIQHA